jgi:hypothetical protein
MQCSQQVPQAGQTAVKQVPQAGQTVVKQVPQAGETTVNGQCLPITKYCAGCTAQGIAGVGGSHRQTLHAASTVAKAGRSAHDLLLVRESFKANITT